MAKPVFYDEMNTATNELRPHYDAYGHWLGALPKERLARKKAEADLTFHRLGITFAVYGEEEGTERLIPFDLLPRVIPHKEWMTMEKGLAQRVRALNAFTHDIYHDQEILRAGIIPADQVLRNSQYRPEMQGVDVPNKIMHISLVLIWCVPVPASFMYWKIIYACPLAFLTCSKIAK